MQSMSRDRRWYPAAVFPARLYVEKLRSPLAVTLHAIINDRHRYIVMAAGPYNRNFATIAVHRYHTIRRVMDV